jgi:hypothetical protein
MCVGQPLACNTILYRGVRTKRHINKTQEPPKPTVDLFIRRPSTQEFNDDDGLSLGIAELCPLDEFRQRFPFGVFSLHVGHIRALGLDIIIDPEDPTHALITNLPSREAQPVDAEFLADALRGQSRLVPE